MVDLVVECDGNIYTEVSKDVSKIVKWCNKQFNKYFNALEQVDGCILVTSTNQVDKPSWCAFDSLHSTGVVSGLKIIETDDKVQSKLHKLANKLSDFNYTIGMFESNPVGIHPYFMFNKDGYEYCLVLTKTLIDIHARKVD